MDPQYRYPKGMIYLFLTGLWERFSYYGITALLILYLFKCFDLSDSRAYLVYGAYASMVYGTPIIGGILADKYIGQYHSIIIGAILIAAGHFVMIVPSPQSVCFFIGLSLVIVGTGLFKPSIGVITGALFEKTNYKRNEGFTLLYIGMNIGTIIAPIVCSYIAVTISWNLAFGVAGIGMLIGLFIFLFGAQHYSHITKKETLFGKKYLGGCLVLFALNGLVLFIFFLLKYPEWTSGALYVIGIAVILLIINLIKKSSVLDRNRIYITSILTFFYMLFMILLQQSGGMMNVFTDRNVNREVFGASIPTSVFQSVEPFFIILFGPLFTYLSGKMKINPYSYPVKFATGLMIMSFSFFVLVLAILLTAEDGLISFWWINLSYLFQALGELFIGPIGLAMISVVAPKKNIGFFMGVWVLSSAFANFFAASFGAMVSENIELAIASTTGAIKSYSNAFVCFTLLGILSSLALFFISPYLNKKIKVLVYQS